ncbi:MULTISPECIES: hypothetical protein [Aphanothece]|uniref:hypothetical protein n=1 Tax=Aphanothece TaxID=1121 RepID=UPI0039848BD4
MLGLLGVLAPASAEGYGRWEAETNTCTLRTEAQAPDSGARPQTCRAIRLEQNLEGMLTVRFLSTGVAEDVAVEQLIFVGQLATGQEPMRCNREARCDPQWPTSLTVTTVAASRYSPRGLLISLPRTHLARGSCRLEERQLRCEARSTSGGASWEAEARR